MSETVTQTRVWLEQWRDGDREGLDRLLERDLDWVRNRVAQRLGALLQSRGEVDDYVQDAIVEVLQYGPKFVLSDQAQFRGLVARVAENVLRDHISRLKAGKRDVQREQAVPTDSTLELDPPEQSVTRPSMATQKTHERAWIRLAIELLPPADREVIRLREWEDLTFADLGTRLGVSEDAARMRFQRILPRLARNVRRLQEGRLPEVLAAELDGEDAGVPEADPPMNTDPDTP